MISVLLIGQHDVGECAQVGLQVMRPLRKTLVEDRSESPLVTGHEGRLLFERFYVLDHTVDHPIPEFSHAGGFDPEQVRWDIERIHGHTIFTSPRSEPVANRSAVNGRTSMIGSRRR